MASPDPYADFGKSPRARAAAESEEWKAGKEQVFGVIDEMKALTEHWMTRGQKAEQMIAHLLDLPPPQGQAQVSELYEMAQRRQQKMNEWKKERAQIFQRVVQLRRLLNMNEGGKRDLDGNLAEVHGEIKNFRQNLEHYRKQLQMQNMDRETLNSKIAEVRQMLDETSMAAGELAKPGDEVRAMHNQSHMHSDLAISPRTRNRTRSRSFDRTLD